MRFALFSEPGAPPRRHRPSCTPATIRACRRRSRRPRRSSAARPRSVIACGAGPVVGRTLKLTNAPWVMDGPETARRTGLEAGLAAQRFRGAGAVAADDSAGLGAADRPARVRARGPAGDSRARAPGSASPRWSRRTDASRRCRRRPATSISGRSRRRNSRSGRISSARMGASPARASFPARGWRGSTARA